MLNFFLPSDRAFRPPFRDRFYMRFQQQGQDGKRQVNGQEFSGIPKSVICGRLRSILEQLSTQRYLTTGQTLYLCMGKSHRQGAPERETWKTQRSR